MVTDRCRLISGMWTEGEEHGGKIIRLKIMNNSQYIKNTAEAKDDDDDNDDNDKQKMKLTILDFFSSRTLIYC